MYPSPITAIKQGIGVWVFLSLLLLSVSAHSLPSATVPADEDSFISLTEDFYYLLDTENRYTSRSIRQQPNSLFRAQKNYLLPATNGTRIWYRFTLQNNSPQALQRLLDLSTTFINRAELFYEYQGEPQHLQAGLDFGSQQDSVTSPVITFPVKLEANSRQTFHLLIQSNYTPGFYPRLTDALALNNYTQPQTAMANLISGILLGGIIYLLLISWLLKERAENIYFISFILSSLGVLSAYHHDTLKQFSLSPESAAFPAVLITMQALNGILFITFFRKFFPVKATCTNSNNLLTLMAIAFACTAAYSIFSGDFRYTHQTVSNLAHLLLVLMFVLTIIFWRKGHPYAGYYALTLSSFVLFKGIYLLCNMDVLPPWLFSRYYYGISNCIMVFVFAMTLAHRVSQVKEEQLKNAADASKAHASSQAKSDFLAKMSHEIRTPMNGVLGMVQLLKETPLNHSQKSYINVVEHSGETLLKVINDILDYSKVEAGKMQLETTIFNLEQLLGSVSSLFIEQSQEKDIDLFASVHPDVPANFYGDPTRITQILVNLLSNAFKFTEHGRISVAVKQITITDSDYHLLRFSVSDTGIGIDEDRAANLFQAFEQADTSTTRLYGGTGLGLTICQQLVELMGGQISVNSNPGAGTTFWFDLPLIEAEVPEMQQYLQQEQQQLTGLRLLICDSHENYAQALRAQAESWQIHATITDDCHTVTPLMVEAADRGEAYDLLVLEHTEQCDGLTIAETISRHPQLQATQCFVSMRQGSTDLYSCPANVHLSSRVVNISEWRHLFADSLSRNDSSQLPASHETSADFSNLQLLIVEDNDINRQVISGMLKKLKVKWQTADNGEEALELIRLNHNRFDMVLMDCEMPVMDGYSATRAIRRFEQDLQLSRMPIIALTAHALDDMQEKSLAAGMDGHLTKPLQLKTLETTILQWVSTPEQQTS